MGTQEVLYNEAIKNFEPKIKKVLSHTSPQDREDMEQELKTKIYEKASIFEKLEVPGFIEFVKDEQ